LTKVREIRAADGTVIKNPFLRNIQIAAQNPTFVPEGYKRPDPIGQKSGRGMFSKDVADKLSASMRMEKAGKGSGSFGKATYNWANVPLMDHIEKNTFDAKNIPYSAAITIDGQRVNVEGLALKNYGWNERNIEKYVNLGRERYLADDKSGGMKEIYEKMLDWASTRSPDLVTYLETGNIPKGLKIDTVLRAADYGLRGTGQKQQTKYSSFFGKVGNFLKSNLGTIIGVTIGLTVPGAQPYAAYLAAAGNAAQSAEAGEDPWEIFQAGMEGYYAGQTAANTAGWASGQFGTGQLQAQLNAPTPKVPKIPSVKLGPLDINVLDALYTTGTTYETYDAYKDYMEQQKQQKEAQQTGEQVTGRQTSDLAPATTVGQQVTGNQQGAIGGLPPAAGRFANRFQRYR
tara:strand:- start:1190 stop:2392 length:1203 start_codon:yes stop_codon:yes gene_type:complete